MIIAYMVAIVVALHIFLAMICEVAKSAVWVAGIPRPLDQADPSVRQLVAFFAVLAIGIVISGCFCFQIGAAIVAGWSV